MVKFELLAENAYENNFEGPNINQLVYPVSLIWRFIKVPLYRFIVSLGRFIILYTDRACFVTMVHIMWVQRVDSIYAALTSLAVSVYVFDKK